MTGDKGASRRAALAAGLALIGLGAAALWALQRRSQPAPGPEPRRLLWSDLRPKAAEAAALRARIEARRRGELGLPPERAASDVRSGLAIAQRHDNPMASDWIDGGALNTGVSADGPFSWDSGRPPGPEDLVAELDGALVALPGYAVPLDLELEGARSFLLAPYVGACIHVPPPPANQIVLVHSKTPQRFERVFEAILATGVMRIAPTRSRLAEVGYQLDALRIEPFDPDADGAGWALRR